MTRFRWPTLFAVLVLVIAACGDSDSTRDVPQIDDTAPAATTAAPAAADDDASMDDDDTHMADDDASMDDDDTHMDDDDTHMDDDDTHMDDGGGHGDDYVPEAQGEPTAEFDVVLGDIFFEPAAVTVSAGQTVRFHLVNEGVIEHEFRLSNAHRIEEHIASGHEDHGDEGGHHEGERDIVVTLGAGESRTIDVTFPTDTSLFTEIACLIPGHYEAGMKAALTYE